MTEKGKLKITILKRLNPSELFETLPVAKRDWMVPCEIFEDGQEIILPQVTTLNLGRGQIPDGTTPMLDLTLHGAYKGGVSRFHARIHRQPTGFYIEDLLSTNQECLELNEFLKKAQNLIAEGETTEASLLLDQIMESCKYLIAPREKRPELEVAAKVYGMPRESAFILISVSIITLIVTLALIAGWAHIRAKRKEKMKY